MSENKTVGSMTDRQRRALAGLLRGEAATAPQPQAQPRPALAPALAAV
jgi:hypothetical protein